MATTKKDVGAKLHKGYASFRVWAPFADAVEVTGTFNDWARTPLDSEGDGYWYGKVKGAEAGQEYKFVIHNGEHELIKNDPRSLQVTTNAGNSVLVEADFDWEGDNFTPPAMAQQVLYELHVGTFNRADPATIGTFERAIEKLDYLADLGITTIELMPICSMAMDRGWGYATDYIYAVESLYGGHHGLLQFVKAAHARGLAVVLDVVYNHFGPDDELDLWQFDGWNQDGKGGIYFYNDYRAVTPWGDTRPDFGRHEVQQYILDNVRMWLRDCHLDGLRLDSTIYMRNLAGNNDDPEHDLPDGWHMLQQVTDLSRKLKPAALLIAEDVASNDFITKPTIDGGAGFMTQWEVIFPGVLRSALDAVNDSDRNLTEVCRAIDHIYNGDAFGRVIYSDSHDSAANGSTRLTEQIAPENPTNLYARRRALLAATLVLTAPGIPMLLQGQEFLQDGSFNDWQALDWDKTEQFAGIVLAHKHLIALRKNLYGNSRGLTGQSCKVIHLNEEDKVLAYHRWQDGGNGDDVVIAANFANKTQSGYRLQFPRDGVWKIRFDSGWHGYSPDFKNPDADSVTVSEGFGAVDFGPYSALILSQDGTE